jgi:hypothetical protein
MLPLQAYVGKQGTPINFIMLGPVNIRHESSGFGGQMLCRLSDDFQIADDCINDYVL